MAKQKSEESNENVDDKNCAINALMDNAESFYDSGNYIAAIGYCNAVSALDEKYSDAYGLKIMALVKLSRNDEAISCCNIAITNCPDNPGFYSNKGAILHALGKVQPALACYDAAIKLNPDFAAVYYNLGNLLYTIGSYSEAINYYNTAIKLDPSFDKAISNREFAMERLSSLQIQESSEEVFALGEIYTDNEGDSNV